MQSLGISMDEGVRTFCPLSPLKSFPPSSHMLQMMIDGDGGGGAANTAGHCSGVLTNPSLCCAKTASTDDSVSSS